jgi:hypothetical protein
MTDTTATPPPPATFAINEREARALIRAYADELARIVGGFIITGPQIEQLDQELPYECNRAEAEHAARQILELSRFLRVDDAR